MIQKAKLTQICPNQLIAVYTCAQAEQLVNYDYHRVRVSGRLAVMLTFHWMPLGTAPEPLTIKVIFAYAEKHPPAPAAVQAIVDTLLFERNAA